MPRIFIRGPHRRIEKKGERERERERESLIIIIGIPRVIAKKEARGRKKRTKRFRRRQQTNDEGR